MKSLSYATLALILATLASSAVAQQRVTGPHLSPINPSMSLSAPATNPVAAQIQDDYAARLQAEQRQLLQRNPSGLTRRELDISHALNGFTPR